MSEKTDIKSMNLEELKTFFSDMGEKAFRAKQVYEWLHVRQVESFEEMTNLSKTLRERLDETCRIITLRKEQVQISKLDGTRKYLFLLEDGNVIESVLMKYKHGNSVCIFTGRLSDGMPVLCINTGRTGERTCTGGNAGSDLSDW